MTRNESYSKIRHHVDGHIDKLLYKVARPHKTDIENKRNLEVESVEVESVLKVLKLKVLKLKRLKLKVLKLKALKLKMNNMFVHF